MIIEQIVLLIYIFFFSTVDSCTTTAYMPMYSFLCQQGRYAILHVNYRGSTGFGKAALESITGKIGSQDVEDVKLLTEAALERNQLLLDSDRVGTFNEKYDLSLITIMHNLKNSPLLLAN